MGRTAVVLLCLCNVLVLVSVLDPYNFGGDPGDDGVGCIYYLILAIILFLIEARRE